MDESVEEYLSVALRQYERLMLDDGPSRGFGEDCQTEIGQAAAFELGCARDDLLAYLHAERIGAVVNYRPIHLMSYFATRYGYRVGNFPISEWIGNCTISLPFYPDMPIDDVSVVAQAVQECLDQARQRHGLSSRARHACPPEARFAIRHGRRRMVLLLQSVLRHHG